MMEDLIKKYDELYEDMAKAKDPRKMMVFGDAEKWMFHQMAEKHPEIAERWLTKLESARWHNYLSKSEAEYITSNLINQDNTRGPHWSYDTFKGAVESLSGKMAVEPSYNCWALWVTANMLYSDHAGTVNMFIQPNMRGKVYYHLALDKLKDVDRPHFIRKYFSLDK